MRQQEGNVLYPTGYNVIISAMVKSFKLLQSKNKNKTLNEHCCVCFSL